MAGEPQNDTLRSKELETVFDFLPLMYFVVDDAGGIINVNRAGADALGYSREELIDRDVLDIFYEDDRETVRKQLTQCRAKPDRVAQWEVRKTRKDGTLIWVRENVRPVQRNDGSLVFHIVCEDITDHKHMLDKLTYAEMRYRTLVEKVPAISYAVDISDSPHTTYISPQVECLLGYTPEEWLRDPDFWHACIHPDDQDRVRDEVWRNNETGEPFFLEYRVRTKDGHYRWLRNHGVYMRDEHLRPRYTHGVMIDITDTKLIEEREQELQARLIRAERMETIGLLAGGIAHDLNNLLGPLVGYPDLIAEQLPVGSPATRELRTMRDSALRASDIIQDLLTLARRDNTPQEPTNLNEVVRSYMKTPSYQKLRKDHPRVDMATRLAPELPRVSGSATHLLQVIMNLVQNAFEAIADRGRITLSTSAEQVQGPVGPFDTIAPGDCVVLRVEDTGCGIAADDLEHIFEPFYTRKGIGRRGTGLGLSVVYGILKDMQGAVDIQSTIDKGTAFSLYLPVSHKPTPTGSGPVDKPSWGGSERLLIVDDIPEQRELACRLLSNLGYGVTAAASGEDALEAMGQSSFDLVILDMILGDGPDGLDVLGDILRSVPGQRCILMSGYAESDRVRKALKLGADSCIRKPFTMEKLGGAVRAALDRDVSAPSS